MRGRLRQIQIRWPVMALVLILAVGALVFISCSAREEAVSAANTETDRQVTLSQKEMEMAELQKTKDSVGKNAYIESKAREEGMIREGELIFHVENPELLDGYTEEELQRLLEERQVYDEFNTK